uniref:Ubiquitin carboxyl-terminal hydrolase n=1 Tax=Schistosoma haematobium TaxID=6185 RepID=A0A094ZZS8_SCHHA
MSKLGVVEESWKFIDIFSLDDDMLAFVPEPVISLLFLYPLETSIENASLGVKDNSSNVVLIKQTVGNACGTIAILHAIAPNAESKTNLHFVCFVEHDGSLYELDGRKNAPVLHGSITTAGFLKDACNVVKKFITCLPGSVEFSLMGLCSDNN